MSPLGSVPFAAFSVFYVLFKKGAGVCIVFASHHVEFQVHLGQQKFPILVGVSVLSFLP